MQAQRACYRSCLSVFPGSSEEDANASGLQEHPAQQEKTPSGFPAFAPRQRDLSINAPAKLPLSKNLPVKVCPGNRPGLGITVVLSGTFLRHEKSIGDRTGKRRRSEADHFLGED